MGKPMNPYVFHVEEKRRNKKIIINDVFINIEYVVLHYNDLTRVSFLYHIWACSFGKGSAPCRLI